ncbi:MAG: translation initiation factor IF-2 N-terminal domain-containing protein, partial [Acidaminococcaceae bacterium]|nr:translation initiation factor IF-2 N-terminal domain-containing protein [Acidaminococcaceae bacterium]
MGKKRIFEIAKEYGVKSPEIIELLAKHNITKTNFSSVEESDVAIIHAAFSKKAVKQEQPQAVHKTEKPQASGSAEKAKPAATSSPAKPRPEKTERPSMIVKP